MPREGAARMLAVLDRINASLRGDVTGFSVDFDDREKLQAIAEELRASLGK
jgi:hypothetical protein